MTTKFSLAPEVQAIAEDLIPEHHRHLWEPDLARFARAARGAKQLPFDQ